MATPKYNRSYVLNIQSATGDTITVKPPFTIEFDIQRNILTSANFCNFRIYNLSEKTRNLIRKNRWDYDDLRLVSLQAGYGTNLPSIFIGNVTRAWSARESNNMITNIEAYDGGYAFSNAQFNKAYPVGTDQKTIITDMIISMYNFAIQPGHIGDFLGGIGSGNSYTGSTTDLLRDLTGGAFFIDNGRANVLKDTECFDLPTLVISSDSGLLGTPLLEDTYLSFDIIFEPTLVIGQRVLLQSITGANFNTFYKVMQIHHKGTISAAVCGDAITSVGLYAPSILNSVPQFGAPTLSTVVQ